MKKASLHHVTREDSVVVSGHGVPIYLKLQTLRSCLSLVCSLALGFFLIVVHKIVNTSFGCVLCRSTGTGQGKREKRYHHGVDCRCVGNMFHMENVRAENCVHC